MCYVSLKYSLQYSAKIFYINVMGEKEKTMLGFLNR